MSRLKEITLEITQRCPNCCLHCSSLSFFNAKNEMPISLIEKTIKEAKQLGATVVSISGGEPFVYPDLIAIADCIRAESMKCFIYSSGISCSDGQYKSVSKSVLEHLKGNVDKLIINIESVNSANYSRIMGVEESTFPLMQKTVVEAISLGLEVEAHMVPMRINKDEIQSVVQWCHEVGIKKVSFLRLVHQGRAKQNEMLLSLNSEEIEEVKRTVKKLQRDGYDVRLGIPFGECGRKINCQAGTAKLDIRYDGMVFPCEAFKDDSPAIFAKYAPNSIYEKSLTEIYDNSAYLINMREALLGYQSLTTSEPCANQYYRRDK